MNKTEKYIKERLNKICDESVTREEIEIEIAKVIFDTKKSCKKELKICTIDPVQFYHDYEIVIDRAEVTG